MDPAALAAELNRRLHLAKVDADQRAVLVALTLLALDRDPALPARLARTVDPAAAVAGVNELAMAAFAAAGRLDVWPVAELRPPAGQLAGYAAALTELAALVDAADLLAEARAGDMLGACFEAFLRYRGGRDLGTVLTPRHLCAFAAEVLDIGPGDRVYDPAAGTGGFLIAAYDRVKAAAGAEAAAAFAAGGLHGAEASARVGVLALANLALRGGGAGHLRLGSAFDAPAGPAATKALLNPPFGLKGRAEREADFVDHAVARLVPGGLLFAVLPASVLFDAWVGRLLASCSLLAVVALPPDLFYPVATETVGVVLRSGSPHDGGGVLWARVADDGFVKRKGQRVERAAAPGPLAALAGDLRAWVGAGQAPAERRGQLELHPLRAGTEPLPQAHLGPGPLDEAAFAAEVGAMQASLSGQLWDQARRVGSHG